MRQREFYFDAAKAVLMLLVVCLHAIEIGSRGTEWDRAIYFFIELFVMPSFLFVQGHLSKSTVVSDQKILGKCLFYFMMFCIGKLFYYGGFYLIDGAFPPWTEKTFWHEGSVPWYMLSSVFFTASLWLARRVRCRTLLMFSIATGVSAGCFSGIGTWLSLSRTLIFIPFYLAGYYFSNFQLKKLLAWKSPIRRKLAGGAVIGLIAILWTSHFMLQTVPVAYDIGIPLLWGNTGYAVLGLSVLQGCFCRTICYLTSVASGCAFLLAVPAKGRFAWVERIINRVGANTLPVYLLHYPVLLLLWRKVFPQGISIALLIMVCIGLTLALSLPTLSKPIDWLREKALELAAPI